MLDRGVIRSEVLNAKLSHHTHSNDDYEVLKLEDFRGPLRQISKLSRPYCVFTNFPGPEKWMLFSMTFTVCDHPQVCSFTVYTVSMHAVQQVALAVQWTDLSRANQLNAHKSTATSLNQNSRYSSLLKLMLLRYLKPTRKREMLGFCTCKILHRTELSSTDQTAQKWKNFADFSAMLFPSQVWH